MLTALAAEGGVCRGGGGGGEGGGGGGGVEGQLLTGAFEDGVVRV
jgi:hypothetical protein